ncbi:MAG: hypothetical protein M1827_007010 [Pycnora praestabilis]|nr:MAG: hypothetical protein M1827_007010 [Pycnora praestabilis]
MAPVEAEYDTLPPAVRRKYFSTLERLRMASETFPVRKASIPEGQKGKGRPPLDRRQSSNSSLPRRLRKRESIRDEYLISQTDAQWFLKLPDKIRRKHFTREEQLLLARNCESILPDASDEALQKLRRQVDRRSTGPRSTSAERSSVDSSASGLPVEINVMDTSIQDSFRWLNEEEDLNLALDDYHRHAADSGTTTLQGSSAIPRRPSFRRSFGSSSFRRTSITSTSQVPPSPLGQSTHQWTKPGPTLETSRKHDARLSFSKMDPEAAYYQDPEARLKLRVYLASPQKFDEAIEFGFPSTESPGRDSRRPSRARLEMGKSDSDDVRTFLDDDHGSLFDDADDASSGDDDVPTTPPRMDQSFRSPHRLPSLSDPPVTDPDNLQVSTPRRKPSEQYPSTFASSREMTMRMTLTRPDLRANESTIYGWQGKSNDDPLALEALPSMIEETTGVFGPFGGADGWGSPPREEGMVKKLWRKVKPGGSKSFRS